MNREARFFIAIILLVTLTGLQSLAQISDRKAELLSQVGEVKLIDPFDVHSWPLTLGAERPESGSASNTSQTSGPARENPKPATTPGSNTSQTSISKRADESDKLEGSASTVFSYNFEGATPGELVYILRRFGNWRCDFSFHPLGISLWVKGAKDNPGELRLTLLQANDLSVVKPQVSQMFTCTDTSGAIRCDGWTRVIFPFSDFEPMVAPTNAPADAELRPLDLSSVIGYRIELVNSTAVSGAGEFRLDKMEQLTSFRPQWNKNARFSSLFIQIGPTYADADWDKIFSAGKRVGITTWFLQYCVGHKKFEHCAYYKNCSLPWITERYDIVDKMFEAAERLSCKIVVGPYFQYWGDTDITQRTRYAEMLTNNKLVIDELAANFGSSPAFAGWYIADEFHDGSARVNANWYPQAATEQLAWYLEENASYMKSKVDAPVCIAPALWKGHPARMTGEWFGRLFSLTPSIDELYLQDCCGRGPDTVMSVGVDLANYYTEIKKACDANGVAFGVDIESFFRCSMLKMPRRQKTWKELAPQLWMAGAFTDKITNFSWATFKPGYYTYEGYKKYFDQLGE